jgi:UDP:flavonoid glycosyltransferase YjiC (YdhE family)
MKIIVATIGSRGDVQPYINLCQGLKAAGHEVTLATNPTLCPLAAAHGVHSAPVGPAVDMGAVGARLMAQSFNNMWIGMIRVMQLGARLVEEAFPDVLQLCRDADLVIASDTGSGIAEAEALGRPWISVTLQPGRIPVPKSNPTLIDRTVWPVLAKLFILPTNRFRKKVGAPAVKDISALMSDRMILLPVSRHVAPADPRWPGIVRSTGYWFARPEGDWSPPPDLVAFLQAGEKPVAVSLGVMSMAGKQARQSVEIVLQALQQANLRAVVQGWDEAFQNIPVPGTIFQAGSLPHSWLFDQVSAVVHHGGFGTTAAVLRSGAPGIVIPHIIDQFYWGMRVHELGAGPRFIPRGQLSANKLSAALTQAVSDPGMRLTSAELGECIRSEPDGVITAVRMIESADAGWR